VTPCPDCEPSPWWYLFDATAFMTRDRCGDFPAWLVALWVVPSVLLFLAYTAIACRKWWTALAMRGTTFPWWASLTVGGFFVGCGVGHLGDALAFVWPAYRFFAFWSCYTAVVSLVGVWAIVRLSRWQEWQWTHRAEMERAVVSATTQVEIDKYEMRRLRHDLRNKEHAVALAEDMLRLKDLQVEAMARELAALRGGGAG